MTQNLRLPLCPKCGDTKHAAPKPDSKMGHKMAEVYGCSSCNIEWSADTGILDEHGKLHRTFHELRGPNYTKTRGII